MDKNLQNRERVTALSERLMAMFDEDQASLKATAKKGSYKTLQRKHAEELEQIVTEIGWPTINLVGEKASQSAWLVAQHSDHDLEFQKRALEIMKALPDNAVKKSNIAYLEDRVLVNSQKLQIYGTQTTRNEQGVIVPRPIQDQEQVNERRKSMGLEPLEEYLQSCQEIANEMLEAEKMATSHS